MAEFEVIEDDTPLGKFVYDGFAEEFQPRVEGIAAEFGLRSYYGVPVSYEDTVVASVIAIHDETYDFEAGDPSVVERLRELRDDIEADIETHFG